jgi:hypothetical protein
MSLVGGLGRNGFQPFASDKMSLLPGYALWCIIHFRRAKGKIVNKVIDKNPASLSLILD